MKYSEITKVIVVTTMAFMMTGCASYMSMKSSEEEIQRGRVYASGDSRAIKAVNLGIPATSAIRAVKLDGDGIGIGLDVSNLQALSLHPFRQVGAAVLDAGMLYGAYVGIDSLNSSKDSGNNTVGGDQTSINGDGNTVNVRTSDESTTSAP
jgi:hypothetical protein